jgi:PadR family transcriptional regulator PadR
MRADRAEDTREWLVPFLLLCMRGGDLRGQEMMGRLAGLGFGAVRPGEVFRTLRRSEAAGLVFSDREHLVYLLSQRRYGLTESGRAYIEFLAESLRSYSEEIEVFLRAYADRPLRGAYG